MTVETVPALHLRAEVLEWIERIEALDRRNRFVHGSASHLPQSGKCKEIGYSTVIKIPGSRG